VEGRVIDSESKLPINGAKISVIGLLGGRNVEATSDRDGRFQFDPLTAGSYIFLASAKGYGEGPSPQREISAGAKISVEIALIPESEIEGKVVDDVTRTPLAGITLRAIREDRDLGPRVAEMAHAITNKAGEYSFSRLLPGKYFLVAEPPPADPSRKLPAGELPLVPTWFPDALHRSDAVAVYVMAGHLCDGTDIHLRKASVYSISGSISGIPEITDREELIVRLAAEGDPLYGERIAILDRKGIFSFTDVLPGRYTARLLRKTKDRAEGIVAAHLLAVGDVLIDKSDVMDLRLSVRWPIAISGTLSVDDSPDADLKGVYVFLIPTEGIVSAGWLRAELKDDGIFQLPTCDPVRYAVRVVAPGTYVRSITFNHREVLPSGIIDVSNGGGRLDVFLHKGGAELAGTLEAQPGSDAMNPAAKARAVLIPVDWSPDWAINLPSAKIENGSFSIRNVRPGTYYALALEAFDLLWKNPGLVRRMQSRGDTVTLDEDDHVSVHLKLITAAEVQQAAFAVEQ
jgi:hypothetical protein